MKQRWWRPLDLAVVGGTLFLSFLLFLFLRPTEKGVAVTVYIESTPYGEFSLLDAPAEHTVMTEKGSLRLSFDEDGVSVSFADCPEKTCVRTGKISRKGESIVCVPLGVCITVEGGSLDGVTG